MRKPELSEATKRGQMQASIERLERRQAETSRKLDQISGARSKAVKTFSHSLKYKMMGLFRSRPDDTVASPTSILAETCNPS